MTTTATTPRPRFKPGTYSYAFKLVRDSGSLASMSGAAAKVYLAMLLAARWVDIGGGVAGGLVRKLSQTELARQTGLCERSVRDAIRELERLQLLVTRRTGRGAGIAGVYLILTENPAPGCRFFHPENRQRAADESGRIMPKNRHKDARKAAAECRPTKGKETNSSKGLCASHGEPENQRPAAKPRHEADPAELKRRAFIGGLTDAQLTDLKARAVAAAGGRLRARYERADPRADRMLQLAIMDQARTDDRAGPVAAAGAGG